MECRGEHDIQENVEGASLETSEYYDRVLPILAALPTFDMTKSPVAGSNEEVSLNTKHKTIPIVFQMIQKGSFSNYQKYDYEIDGYPRYHMWQKVSWNTRCKPVAVYTSFIDSRNIINSGTYSLTHRKGSSTMESWWKETTASAGAAFKGVEASVSVTTGYKYEKTYTEETVTGWTETLDKGDYMLYQNKVVYAYEIKINDPSTIKDVKEHMDSAYDYDRTTPKTYIRGGRLFYFADFNKNDPFIKPLSSDLYQTIGKLDDVADYLMSDHGWSRW